MQSVGLPKLSSTAIRKQEVHTNGPVLDDTILADPEVSFMTLSVVAEVLSSECRDSQLKRFICNNVSFFFQIAGAIENEKVVSKTIQIYNIDRAVCGRVAGTIAKKYGDIGFAGQINLT